MAEQTETLERVEGRFAWLGTRVDGRSLRVWIAIGVAIAAAALGFGAVWTYGLDRQVAMEETDGKAIGQERPGMQMQQDGQAGMGDMPTVPPVQGFYDGKQIAFIHTEVSDANVAQVLTRMMGSPVVVVPGLARVPASALADVYVFTNGVEGMGPMGFQADVFDSAPGDPGYSPLRALNLVAWKEGAEARLLRSHAEVEAAARAGEITIERPGVVVNMPLVTWPGGGR